MKLKKIGGKEANSNYYYTYVVCRFPSNSLCILFISILDSVGKGEGDQ
jgi:hypothetical protein